MTRDELAAMDDDARLAAGRAAAASVGGRATGRLVGRLRVPEIERAGVLFVLVPGGVYEMGFSPEEMKTLLRVARLGPGVVGADYWRPIYERAYEAARPARTVDVPPFLCARAPLLDGHVRAIDATLVHREPFAEARGITDAVPAYVAQASVAPLLRSVGARLVTDAEWEYVARGAGRPQIDVQRRDLHDPVADAHARPGFADAHEAFAARREDHDDEEDELMVEEHEAFVDDHLGGADDQALGVWGLSFGEWTAGGATRGGAVLSYPWQDSCEILFAHPAYRTGATHGGLATVRPVLDLPPSS